MTRNNIVLATVVSAVLVSSAFIISGGSFLSTLFAADNHHGFHQAGASALPFVADNALRNVVRFGEAAERPDILQINTNFIEPHRHCEFCIWVNHRPGADGKAVAGFADEEGPVDLTGSRRVAFYAMGNEGGEQVQFRVAINDPVLVDLEERKNSGNNGSLPNDRVLPSGTDSNKTAASRGIITQPVTLTNDWELYQIDISNADLSDVAIPFAFEVGGNARGDTQFYLKRIVYDSEAATVPLETIPETTTVANVTSLEANATTTSDDDTAANNMTVSLSANSSRGSAPLAVMFEADLAGVSTPSILDWDFGDGNVTTQDITINNGTEYTQWITHTFTEPAVYNVSASLSDLFGNITSDTIEIVVSESGSSTPSAQNLTTADVTDSAVGNATDIADDGFDVAGDDNSSSFTAEEDAIINDTADDGGVREEGLSEDDSEQLADDEETSTAAPQSNITEDETEVVEEDDNSEPVAEAGRDLFGWENEEIILDGTKSQDPDGDNLEYEWTQESGPEADINDANSAATLVTLPSISGDDEEEIVFSLSVTDGESETQDQVSTNVLNDDSASADEEESERQQTIVLYPKQPIESEWQGSTNDCDSEPALCLSDTDDSTFVLAGEDREDTPRSTYSFDEFEVTDAEINSIQIRLTAALADSSTGYLSLVFADEDHNTPDSDYNTLDLSITSDSFEQYSGYVLDENPLTEDAWTVDSLNSLYAGFEYTAGQADIHVSELELVVQYVTNDDAADDSAETDDAADDDSVTEAQEPEEEQPETESDNQIPSTDETLNDTSTTNSTTDES